MIKQSNKGVKQKKQRAVIRLAVSGMVSFILLLSGQFLLLAFFTVLLFVFNELFLADHNFYDPRGDDQYSFKNAHKIAPNWLDENLTMKPSWDEETFDTALLAIAVHHDVSGQFLDPFVTITSGSITRQQYFERSVHGLRYINVSDFISADEDIVFTPSHCQLITEQSELLLFSNPSLKNKKVLVIAPHADDAEIAAFGLYSTQDSAIVTLTAGEIGAKDYESAYTNSEQASLLKGRLRAWDSMAIPQWAGLKPDDVIQLGYFCMRLKEMHDSPDESISSKTAGVQDTRVFRAFNSITLDSDQHGKPSWNTLVSDLVECIERIKPDVIITPHTVLDPHADHYYATLALMQALALSTSKPAHIYSYANHLVSSDMFPFGPVHTLASLPPNTIDNVFVNSVVSIPLTLDQQKDKAAALAMMHDLQTPLRWKKRLRCKLQSWFIGRELSPYGEDEYLRKAIRSNELFFKQNIDAFLSDEKRGVNHLC